ncbi:DUF222 domain-containing protein, partial [Micromonospora zhanjiangensis]
MMAALARADEQVSSCVDVPVWALSEADLVGSLVAVHRLEQRLAAVKLALIREVDGRALGGGHGASSTAVWLRDRLRVDVRTARRTVALASALDGLPNVVRVALGRGVVGVEQSQAICDALGQLPETVGAEVVDKAAQALVDAAADFEPAVLRRLGTRILTHVAPDVAEEAERVALERAEARAYDRRHFTLSSPDASGQVRVSGRLDVESAAAVRAAIDPLCAPTGVGDDRSPGQRRADALTEVCRLALATAELPDNGGDRPQIVVTVTLEALHQALAATTLGASLAATTPRRPGSARSRTSTADRAAAASGAGLASTAGSASGTGS